MSLATKRNAYPSSAQKARLISLMQADAELRNGKFSATFTSKVASERWSLIGEELNSIPGAKKTWQNWRKSWQDMKSKVKKKQAMLRRSAHLTGGGPVQQQLTTEEVLSNMNTTAIEDYKVQESADNFDFEDEMVASSLVVTSLGVPPQPTSYEPPPSIEEVADGEELRTIRDHQKNRTAGRRLQRSFAVASSLNKALQEKNILKQKQLKEMRKQTIAINRQTDAFNRQADALNRQADAIETAVRLLF